NRVSLSQTTHQHTHTSFNRCKSLQQDEFGGKALACEKRCGGLRRADEPTSRQALADLLRRVRALRSDAHCQAVFFPRFPSRIGCSEPVSEQGVMKIINVNKLTSAGCKVNIWIEDYFACLSNKNVRGMEYVSFVGNYSIEIWKALGMNMERGKVEFLWSSEEINSRAAEYWPLVLDIAMINKLNIMRACRCRNISDLDEAAQILYPCLQCTDIFVLKADICQLGMNSGEVSALSSAYNNYIKEKNRPIILSYRVQPHLQRKVAKSDTSSAIFMDDDEVLFFFDRRESEDKEGVLPPKVVEGNPCLEYIKYDITLPWFDEFKVECKVEDGGSNDLKLALSKALNVILQSVRDHFKHNAHAKELLKNVKVCVRDLLAHFAQLDSLFESSFYEGSCVVVPFESL
ncbi:hypothetical protein RJ639_010637, partial [Escallonia herrerae]